MPSVAQMSAMELPGSAFIDLARAACLGGQRRFAPSPAAAGARGGEACPGALADQVALEFGQRREDVEDQLAARGRGVGMLLQAFEADAARIERVHGFDQVLERAAEPVELPDDEGVTLAQIVQRRLQAGAVGLRAVLARLQATTFFAPADIIAAMLARDAARKQGSEES